MISNSNIGSFLFSFSLPLKEAIATVGGFMFLFLLLEFSAIILVGFDFEGFKGIEIRVAAPATLIDAEIWFE